MNKEIEKSVLVEPKFQLLNAAHCKAIIKYLIDSQKPFQITCFKQFTTFEAEDMSFLDSLQDMFLLSIENYSMETFVYFDNHIEFKVGFGDTIEAKVTIPYSFIISLEEDFKFNLYRNPSIIFVNAEEVQEIEEKEVIIEQTNNSKNRFLNNPKNQRFGEE